MENYLVFIPSHGGEEKIAQHFANSHYQLAPGLWAVGSAARTSSDLCEIIGIGPELSGVVTSMERYYGHYDQALWQRLDAWSRQA